MDGILNADGTEEKIWESVYLSKHKFYDQFIFQNDELLELCNGAFISADVEILEFFGRVIRFTLTRESNQLFINMLFAGQSTASLFFRDIRRPHRRVINHFDDFSFA